MKKFFICTLAIFLTLILTTNKTYAISCSATRPVSPPVLISAVPGSESVTLTWQSAGDPKTYYLIAYGLSSTSFEYGVPEISDVTTTSFEIGHLINGVKYYFKVRAGNGCKPGEFSNKLSATAGGSSYGASIPNLSMYKRDEDVSKSALFNKKSNKKVLGTSTYNPVIKSCTKTCKATPFLIVEIIALLAFFYYIKKFPFLKPVFSILIPVSIYLLFLYFTKHCTSTSLLCRSFLPLDILIFIVLFILYKKTKKL